jgi:hypothetical protein
MTSDTHNKYVYDAHINSTFIASYVYNNICNAGFVRGYQTVSKSSKRSNTDMSDHKSIKSRLNDICELLGVDLGYRPEK